MGSRLGLQVGRGVSWQQARSLGSLCAMIKDNCASGKGGRRVISLWCNSVLAPDEKGGLQTKNVSITCAMGQIVAQPPAPESITIFGDMDFMEVITGGRSKMAA